MNKKSFIDRLNLHLDEELSPAESEELLEEIRGNPEYRRIYGEYCKLFSACSRLGDSFAGSSQASPWRQKTYAYGGMAAAVALLLLAGRNLSPILEGLQGDDSLQASVPSSASNAVSEPLLSVDVNQLGIRSLLVGESRALPASDLVDVFERDGTSHDFGTDSDVTFAGVRLGDAGRQQNVWTEEEFAFAEGVPSPSIDSPRSSSASEGDEPVFTVRSIGTAFESSGAGVRFDFGRAAAAVSVSNP